MSFFKQISDRCDELSSIAQVYLDGLPFIASDDAVQRIWKWAWTQVETDDRGDVVWPEDGWDVNSPSKSDMAYNIIDGGVPFSGVPSNGSLHYSLGWSMVAQEANLRSLLEFVEGRHPERIEFQTLAELPEG